MRFAETETVPQSRDLLTGEINAASVASGESSEGVSESPDDVTGHICILAEVT